MTWQGPIPDAESCCPFPALIGLRPAQELDRLARSQQPRGGRPGAPHVHVGLSLHRSYRARLAASPRGAAATPIRTASGPGAAARSARGCRDGGNRQLTLVSLRTRFRTRSG